MLKLYYHFLDLSVILDRQRQHVTLTLTPVTVCVGIELEAIFLSRLGGHSLLMTLQLAFDS